MRIYLPLIFIFVGNISAQVFFSINTEISQSTWMIPVSFKTNLCESVAVKYSGQLFDIEHPNDHYIWYTYHRNGKTFANTESYIEFDNGTLNALFGRKYNPVGHGKLSGLFISPVAPSLDQITFSLTNYYGFNYRHTIIRLDNRFKETDGENNVVNRWYYLNQVGYNYKNVVEINFTDAVISTGYNRGLEWYYANPLVSLFMERKHELHRREGQDSTYVIGIGDNDNHFIGGDWIVHYNQWDVYCEWLIDEWQLTADYRDSVQTIFGVMTGIDYHTEEWSLAIEYSLGSPWLYINRALYGSLEKHGQPIGLRSPQSQCIDVGIDYNIDDSRSISVLSHFEQCGDQTFDTPYDAWDNKLPVFDFKETLPVELKLMYYDKNGKYFKRVGVYHNWFQSGLTQFIIGWDFGFDLD